MRNKITKEVFHELSNINKLFTNNANNQQDFLQNDQLLDLKLYFNKFVEDIINYYQVDLKLILSDQYKTIDQINKDLQYGLKVLNDTQNNFLKIILRYQNK